MKVYELTHKGYDFLYKEVLESEEGVLHRVLHLFPENGKNEKQIAEWLHTATPGACFQGEKGTFSIVVRNSTILISQIAYILYMQDWENTHLTADKLLAIKRDYYASDYADSKDVINSRLLTEPDIGRWAVINGYVDSYYVSYEKFLDTEYQNVAYMERLLGKVLYAEYKKEMDVFL